jgi:hypothetical protein
MQDLVVARVRDVDDSVAWALQRGDTRGALTVALRNRHSLRTHSFKDLVRRYSADCYCSDGYSSVSYSFASCFRYVQYAVGRVCSTRYCHAGAVLRHTAVFSHRDTQHGCCITLGVNVTARCTSYATASKLTLLLLLLQH